MMAAATAPRHLWQVLVVDDDDEICRMLRSSLTFAGFAVTTASDAASAMAAMAADPPDAVVLDVMMPRIDGFDLVQLLRQRGSTMPVLFLSARDKVEDRVRGLRLGADDYITKPFSVIEVTARLESLLRRTHVVADSDSVAGQRAPLQCGDLTIDEERHVARRAGRNLALSPTEYRLLAYLMLHEGRVLSKDRILEHLARFEIEGDRALVERFVFSLRRKVDASLPPLLHTVRGFGYTLRADRSS